jgi:hypothetical protein
MRREATRSLILSLVLVLLPALAQAAGFTEVLPSRTFLLDIGYNYAWLDRRWDSHGRKADLLDPIDMYEPGGGRLGTLYPGASVGYQIVAFQLQYGILDNLSLGIGIPLVIRTSITPNLRWQPGDFMPMLGRQYSASDFWQWAASMGQPKPGPWTGNQGVLGDIIVGVKLRWSDWIRPMREAGFGGSLLVSGALPTGRQADPEQVVSAGTTVWDLQFQGDLSVHLGFDKAFRRELHDRLTLGVDLFYEAFLPHRYTTPDGAKNPLLNNFLPYAGTTYILDGGDQYGASLQVDGAVWEGPARASFLTKGDAAKAAALPPLLNLSLRYTFERVGQSWFHSMSDLWDYQQEDRWRPGYKNILTATALFSFLRLGAPLQVYVTYRTLSLIPGENTRATDVITAGVRLPAKFW